MNNFKCTNCGGTRVEEVLQGVTQSSEIVSIEIISKDESIPVFDYGHTWTDGGDFDTVYYQCLECGDETILDGEAFVNAANLTNKV